MAVALVEGVADGADLKAALQCAKAVRDFLENGFVERVEPLWTVDRHPQDRVALF